MCWIKKIFKGLRIKKLQGGFGLGWSSGKMFDPTDQERTTPTEDFIDETEEETEEMLNKMFDKNKESE